MRFILTIVLLALPALCSAQSAFKSGEQINGLTKTCYYDYLGSTYTKTVASHALCPLSLSVNTRENKSDTREAESDTRRENVFAVNFNSTRRQASGVAFKAGERNTGMTKVCYYTHLGSQYTKTVSNIELCPLTLEVP